jgi:GNAT superfamily N-acetyltransferase
MKAKKFNQLTQEELNRIIDIHYNHWVKHNPKMIKENTIYKFTKLYTGEQLPFGIVLLDDLDNIVGFCVFKIENLKKYPEIYPWISDVMILENYRGKGYGKKLLQYGEKYLKELGYNTIYVWTDQAPDFYKKVGFIYKQEVEKNEGGYGQLFYKNI